MVSLGSASALSAARAWAVTRFPYLSSAIFAAWIVEHEGLGTMSADDRWRVYIDPTLLEGWSSAQLGSLLVHHAGHLVRGHAERARLLQDPTGTSAWLDASDAEINDDLVSDHFDLPIETTLPEDLGKPHGRLAEEYYEPNGRHREVIAGRWPMGVLAATRPTAVGWTSSRCGCSAFAWPPTASAWRLSPEPCPAAGNAGRAGPCRRNSHGRGSLRPNSVDA